MQAAVTPWRFFFKKNARRSLISLGVYLGALGLYNSPHSFRVAYGGFCPNPTAGRVNHVIAAGVPLGPHSDGGDDFFVAPNPTNDNDNENRYLTCTHRQNIGFQYWVCSTHFSYVPAPAILQADTAFYLTEAAWGNTYHIVGGDFNQTPGEGQAPGFPAPTYKWHYANAETHNLNPACLTHGGQGKIDYIFADRLRSTTLHGACAENEPTFLSDHRYIWGWFTL